MTYEELGIFIVASGYAVLFFAGTGSLFLSMFFLYDDGINQLYIGDKNIGWLELLIIPIEFCVMLVFFLVVIRAMF